MNKVELGLSELHGVICWNSEWDVNLGLSIEFGQPSLSIVEPRESRTRNRKLRQLWNSRTVTLHGEWFFWATSAYWKLSVREFGDVTVSSSYKKIRMALSWLNGQKLLRATVKPPTSATQLEFDLGAQLWTRRMAVHGPGDIWSLYKPDGYVLSVRADGKYADCDGATSPDKVVWKPITAE